MDWLLFCLFGDKDRTCAAACCLDSQVYTTIIFRLIFITHVKGEKIVTQVSPIDTAPFLRSDASAPITTQISYIWRWRR